MIKSSNQDTIAAISTPIGEGGIGIVRLSGLQAVHIADSVFASKSGRSVENQKNFTMQYGHVVADKNNPLEIIDEVILSVMRAPKSYTCEDVVEISAHGGMVSLHAILSLLVKRGARLAEPGEFTKRAFLNGRIDLLQAEAVLDLISAKTDLGRQLATHQLRGQTSKKIQSTKDALVNILAHLEAGLDFPEDDPDTHSLGQIQANISECLITLKKILSSSSIGFLVKEGLKVAIVGRPNVGKSSLLNRLCGLNRVIVTPFPGTTRDVVEELIQIKGVPIRLLDTAGVWDSDHPIEQEGIKRSKVAAQEADLILQVLDASQKFSSDDLILFKEISDAKKIIVLNKVDLPCHLNMDEIKKLKKEILIVECSCVSERGLEKLEEAIFGFATHGKKEISDEVVISSLRQKDLVEKAVACLENALKAYQEGLSSEFCAADIRLALDHLGILVGEVVTDDILEVLFKQFCIGK